MNRNKKIPFRFVDVVLSLTLTTIFVLLPGSAVFAIHLFVFDMGMFLIAVFIVVYMGYAMIMGTVVK